MNKRILVVEDDLEHQTLYGDILKDAGFIVEVAGDGVTGEKKIREGDFDGVFLDIILPNVDGMTILKNLEHYPPKGGVPPIILLTNLGDEHVAREGLLHGASRFLMKAKVEPHDIVREARAVLTKKE